jgi:predicted nucleic acid-binding protein
MEQQQYLIDTNAVIDYLGEKLPASGMAFMNGVIDDVPLVSVVTKIEVLGFNAPTEHYQLLKDFMNDATLFGLTDEIVDASIEVRKNHKTKLPDAIIAATALVNRFTVISRNTKDFQNIEGLNCINPYDL